MSAEVGTFSEQNGICKRYFFIMRIFYTKLQCYSLCYRQTKEGKILKKVKFYGGRGPGMRVTQTPKKHDLSH